MGFLDSNGEIIGLDVDLAKATFKSIGTEVIFQPIDWDSKELELNTNKIDIIWNGMSYTPERAENMLVTKAYMQNNQVFIVKSDSNIFNLNDLNNKIICVQKGALQVLQRYLKKVKCQLGEVEDYLWCDFDNCESIVVKTFLTSPTIGIVAFTFLEIEHGSIST